MSWNIFKLRYQNKIFPWIREKLVIVIPIRYSDTWLPFIIRKPYLFIVFNSDSLTI